MSKPPLIKWKTTIKLWKIICQICLICFTCAELFPSPLQSKISSNSPIDRSTLKKIYMTHNRKSKDYLFVKTKTNDKVSLLHESILWQYEMNTKNYECSHLEIQTVFGPFWTTQLNDLFLHDVQYNRFGFLLWKM